MKFTVKPSIMVEDLGSIVVKAGSVIKFEVRINGEPFPEVTWLALGNPLKANKRATIDVSEQNKKTSINIKTAERGDTGKYTLIVKNSSGEVSAEGEVVVLGKLLVPLSSLSRWVPCSMRSLVQWGFLFNWVPCSMGFLVALGSLFNGVLCPGSSNLASETSVDLCPSGH
jgi:hypothetical protein